MILWEVAGNEARQVVIASGKIDGMTPCVVIAHGQIVSTTRLERIARFMPYLEWHEQPIKRTTESLPSGIEEALRADPDGRPDEKEKADG